MLDLTLPNLSLGIVPITIPAKNAPNTMFTLSMLAIAAKKKQMNKV